MKNITLLLALLLAPTSAVAQLKAPQSVSEGEAIHFTLEDEESGLEAIWTVLNPFEGVVVTEIRPKGSNDLIVDPPCGWVGKIRVQCILLDSERKVVDIRLSVVQVGSPDKPVEPPNPPPKPDENDEKDDENKPKPDYDGLNELGMGQISYENAPKADEIKAEIVAKVMDQAADFLKGYPTLKVIKAVGLREGTDYEIYVWLDKQMQQHPEYRKWYDECLNYKKGLGISVGSPVNMHIQLLNEMAAGIRGGK